MWGVCVVCKPNLLKRFYPRPLFWTCVLWLCQGKPFNRNRAFSSTQPMVQEYGVCGCGLDYTTSRTWSTIQARPRSEEPGWWSCSLWRFGGGCCLRVSWDGTAALQELGAGHAWGESAGNIPYKSYSRCQLATVCPVQPVSDSYTDSFGNAYIKNANSLDLKYHFIMIIQTNQHISIW